MIIVLKPGSSDKEVNHIIEKVEALGLKPWLSKGVERCIIGIIGEEDIVRTLPLEGFPGVEKVIPILKPFKLASLEFQSTPTKVDVGGGIVIGEKKIVVMAGPCAVENEDMIVDTAKKVKNAGAVGLRGGAFKPRTSPYSFQGLGEEGLKYMAEAKKQTGLFVVTELMDVRNLDLVIKYADVVQIGARNMQNFDLLKEIGKTKIPVLLKRGIASTIKELLMSAEYILAGGNSNVILCEGGIRTFENYTRNTLDLNAIPALKSLSHLPVVVDPSHGTGRWGMVKAMSLAAVAAGADGLLIEVHPSPENAFSDGDQSLLPETFRGLMQEIPKIAEAVGRTI